MENLKFPESWEQAKSDAYFAGFAQCDEVKRWTEAARIMAESYEKRIAELEQRWISIKDSRPVVNEPVLCYSGEGVMSIEKRRQGQNSIYCDQTDSGYATHWMPLPKPPTK